MPRRKKAPPSTDRPAAAGDTLKTYSNALPVRYLIERAQGAEEITALGMSVRDGVLLAWDQTQGIVRLLAPGQWEGVRVVVEPKPEAQAPPA